MLVLCKWVHPKLPPTGLSHPDLEVKGKVMPLAGHAAREL